MRLSRGVQATERRDVHQKKLRAQKKPRRLGGHAGGRCKGEEGEVKVRVGGHRRSSEFEGCGQRFGSQVDRKEQN